MKSDFQTKRPILLMCLNLPDKKSKALSDIDASNSTTLGILTDIQLALLRLQIEDYFSESTLMHALGMLVVSWCLTFQDSPVSVDNS